MIQTNKIPQVKMYDANMFEQVGINHITGKSNKESVDTTGTSPLKDGIRRVLDQIDLQDAVNRYVWYNLPDGLTGQRIERMLYHVGNLAFFYFPERKRFFCLPYSPRGSLDVYGRYPKMSPLPYGGQQSGTGDGTKQEPWIPGLEYDVVYEVLTAGDFIKEDGTPDLEAARKAFNGSAVLLNDYTPLDTEEVVMSRQAINAPILDVMSNCIPYLNTALSNSTGILGMRINDESEQPAVEAANGAINRAALNGRKYVGITGKVDFQELTGETPAKTEEFMLAMQSLDNFRLGTFGLENGGLFEKKQQMLQSEMATNGGNVGLVMQDGLTIRQTFCDIVNSIWDLGIWCDISENVINMDRNGDMVVGDEQDQSGQSKGQQQQEVSNE